MAVAQNLRFVFALTSVTNEPFEVSVWHIIKIYRLFVKHYFMCYELQTWRRWEALRLYDKFNVAQSWSVLMEKMHRNKTINSTAINLEFSLATRYRLKRLKASRRRRKFFPELVAFHLLAACSSPAISTAALKSSCTCPWHFRGHRNFSSVPAWRKWLAACFSSGFTHMSPLPYFLLLSTRNLV
jgi:hypothetical protein